MCVWFVLQRVHTGLFPVRWRARMAVFVNVSRRTVSERAAGDIRCRENGGQKETGTDDWLLPFLIVIIFGPNVANTKPSK